MDAPSGTRQCVLFSGRAYVHRVRDIVRVGDRWWGWVRHQGGDWTVRFETYGVGYWNAVEFYEHHGPQDGKWHSSVRLLRNLASREVVLE